MAQNTFANIGKKAEELLKVRHANMVKLLQYTDPKKKSLLGTVENMLQAIDSFLWFDFIYIPIQENPTEKKNQKLNLSVNSDYIELGNTTNLISIAQERGHDDVLTYFQKIAEQCFYDNGHFYQQLCEAFQAVDQKNVDELKVILNKIPLSFFELFCIKTSWQTVSKKLKKQLNNGKKNTGFLVNNLPNKPCSLLNYAKHLQRLAMDDVKKNSEPKKKRNEKPLEFFQRHQAWKNQTVETPYDELVAVVEERLQSLAKKKSQPLSQLYSKKKKGKKDNKYYQALIEGDVNRIKRHMNQKNNYCTDYVLSKKKYTPLYMVLDGKYQVKNRWAVANLLLDNMEPAHLTGTHLEEGYSYLDLANYLLQAPNQDKIFYESGKAFVKKLLLIIEQYENNIQNKVVSNYKQDNLEEGTAYFFGNINKEDLNDKENSPIFDFNELLLKKFITDEGAALEYIKKREEENPGELFSVSYHNGSLLHWAVKQQYITIIKYLLETWENYYVDSKPSFLLLKDEQDHTAITLAKSLQYVDISNLLESAIETRCRASEGGNLLFELIRWANKERDAIEKEEKQKKQSYSRTLREQLNVLIKELPNIADYINDANLWGETPLHLAAKHGHYAIVAFLLSYGVKIANRHGGGNPLCALDRSCRTPAQLAEDHGHGVLARWLYLHEAYYDGRHAAKKGYGSLVASTASPQAKWTSKTFATVVPTHDKPTDSVPKNAKFYGHLYLKRLQIAIWITLGIILPVAFALGLLGGPLVTALIFYTLFQLLNIAAFVPIVIVTALPLLVTNILAVPVLPTLLILQIGVILATLEAAVEISARFIYDICVNRLGRFLLNKVKSRLSLSSWTERSMLKQLDDSLESIRPTLYQNIRQDMQSDMGVCPANPVLFYEPHSKKLFWEDCSGESHQFFQTFNTLDKNKEYIIETPLMKLNQR